MRTLAILVLLCSVAAANPGRSVDRTALPFGSAAGRAQAPTVVSSTSIEILEPIKFIGATPAISPTSKKMLDAIAATLDGNPNIQLVAIRAFGNDASHDQWILGERRARAVVGELVRRGVAARRLRPQGAAQPDPGDPGPGPELVILKRGY